MLKYEIIDNFLEKNDYNYINSFSHNVKANEIKVYSNSISNDGKIVSSCFSQDFIKSLALKYNKKALQILNRLCPSKSILWEYTDFNIIITGSNCSFPIHRDTPNKLLSGVIYIKPEKNFGTILYSNHKGDDPRVIEWKQNRGFFFSRNENSFHNYKGDGVSNRMALVYNLCTNDIKSVCKIDDINYFKLKIREKINYYSYRFFNKIF
jgi:hypothetical protein